MCENNNNELELEEQFILRLPLKDAEKIRTILHTKPERIKKHLKINFDPAGGVSKIYVGKKHLYGYLKKFPTIIESYKTNIVNDRTNMYKTANVNYMLECVENPLLENVKKDSAHGYLPPLKNVKKKRFRKTLVNPEVAEITEIIAKELYYLISTDLDAVSTRFEILYEEEKINENFVEIEQEKMLFGQVSSSDSEDDLI